LALQATVVLLLCADFLLYALKANTRMLAGAQQIADSFAEN
jgi:hypothetical protein